MEDNEKDYREEAYKLFRSQLLHPQSERLYSEADLVAVFDYATDHFDDYIRIEALLVGARLYPDSTILLERRGVLYKSCEKNTFKHFMSCYYNWEGTMWRIFQLAASPYTSKDMLKVIFDAFLSDASFDDDEQVVQLVQTAREKGMIDWLYENSDEIRKKVKFLPTFLYEMSVSAHFDGRTDLSIPYLEELTELEPYNSNFWVLLADELKNVGREADALDALEYALAIDPDKTEALRLQCTMTKGKKRRDIFRRLAKMHSRDEEMVCDAVSCALFDKKLGIARSIMKETQSHFRDSARFVALAIDAKYPQLPKMLDDLYNAGVDDVVMWCELGKVALNNRNFDAFKNIYTTYETFSGKKYDDNLMIQYLFSIADYKGVLNVFETEDAPGRRESLEKVVENYFRLIISMLRLGMSAEAQHTMLVLEYSVCEAPLSEIFKRGVYFVIEEIRKILSTNKSKNWDMYDPLGLD